MFGFLSTKNYLKVNRQVFLFAVFIILAGFVAGAVYSNLVTYDSFKSYSGMLDSYIKNAGSAVEFNDSSSDITNLILIFFWSFFLFGKPLSAFFAFKSGFSLGFYISFLVKVYSVRGFVIGLYVLFMYVIFTAVPAVILTARSFTVNGCITTAVFGKNAKSDIRKAFFPYLMLLFIALLLTMSANFINTLIIPKIFKALF